MISSSRVVSAFFAVSFATAGCGTSSEVVQTREAAYAAAAKGNAAFASRDYAGAAEHLSAAVKGGGLNPDAYANAAVKLAVCYGATSKYDQAIALLEELERGAPNLDQIYAARSYVLRKQGKAAESRAALAKARQFNRAVQEFKD